MTADTETKSAPVDVRERLAIALDVDDLVVATRLARQMKPYFGVAKVGLGTVQRQRPRRRGRFGRPRLRRVPRRQAS